MRLRCGQLYDSVCVCCDCLSTGLYFQELCQRVCHQTNQTEGTEHLSVCNWNGLFSNHFHHVSDSLKVSRMCMHT